MADPPPSKEDQYGKTFECLLGHLAISVAGIGLDAGLFEAIGRSTHDLKPAQIARNLKYDERAVEVWCRSAYAFEFLDHDGENGFRLAPHMATILLDPSDVAYMGARIAFANLSHYDSAAYLRFLNSGRPIPRSEHNPELLRIIADLSVADATMLIDDVLPQIPGAVDRLASGGLLLDVGAGAGEHAIRYAERFRQAHIVGLESDAPSVELARRAISEAGLRDRIDIHHADANELDDHGRYDVVTINVVLHETGGPTEQLNVLRRILDSLRPEGVAIVSELPYPDSVDAYRNEPDYRRLAGLMIHEAVVGCEAITQQGLLSLMREAGFSEVRVAEQPKSSRFVVIGARRPLSRPTEAHDVDVERMG